MKKIFLLMVFCLMCSMPLCAEDWEHLKFMGVELNGTIAEFQEKLLKKGLTVAKESELLPTGMRQYNGVFSGEKAMIVVFYNSRSKLVYRAKAMISREGKGAVEQLMSKMEEKLDYKYDEKNKISQMVKDDYLHEFEQVSYKLYNGSIDLFISSTGYSNQNTFYLQIDYKDLINNMKNTSEEMDDL